MTLSRFGFWGVAVAVSAMLSMPRAVRAEPPCAADVRKLCADAPAGGVRACLVAKESSLSEACRNSLDAFGRDMGSLAATCRWDVARFCSDIAPGGGRILGCLQRNRDQLSPECANALAK
jgi:hypothetical protein